MADETDDVTPLAPEDDAAVTALLAALPEPAMPDDVAQRIAVALAEQTPLSGPVPAWAAGGADNVTVLPSPQERAKRRGAGLRVLTGVAASVVVLVGLVVVGVNAFPGGDSGGASMAGSGSAPTEERSSDQQVGALLTTSGTAYSAVNLDTEVTDLVTAASTAGAPLTPLPTSPSSDTGGGESPSPDFSASDGAKTLVANLLGLDVCLTKLDRSGEQPIAADAGTWSGQQAVVLVLHGQQVARVDVYVVAPTCGDRTDADDHMLFFRSVANPS